MALGVDGSMYCPTIASLEPPLRVMAVRNIRSLFALLRITLAATYQVCNCWFFLFSFFFLALSASFSHCGGKLLVFQSSQAALCCREQMVEF